MKYKKKDYWYADAGIHDAASFSINFTTIHPEMNAHHAEHVKIRGQGVGLCARNTIAAVSQFARCRTGAKRGGLVSRPHPADGGQRLYGLQDLPRDLYQEAVADGSQPTWFVDGRLRFLACAEKCKNG